MRMSSDEPEGATQTLARPADRAADRFGGLLPSGVWVRGGETVVMALAIEHFSEGAAVPLLVLSEAPGVIGLDPDTAVEAWDDAGREYEVRTVSLETGLGAAQATIWLSPELPSDASDLRLRVTELMRTNPGRRGGGTAKPLSGGPWELSVPLLPERTATEPPDRPSGSAPIAEAPKAPARAASAFARLLPIGQARMRENAAVCLWGLEDYGERAVLTLAVLTTDLAETEPLEPGRGSVEVWDDAGSQYSVAPIAGGGDGRWSETSLEITPSPGGSPVIGVRVADLPGATRRDDDRSLDGPFTFGVALSESR